MVGLKEHELSISDKYLIDILNEVGRQLTAAGVWHPVQGRSESTSSRRLLTYNHGRTYKGGLGAGTGTVQ